MVFIKPLNIKYLLGFTEHKSELYCANLSVVKEEIGLFVYRKQFYQV